MHLRLIRLQTQYKNIEHTYLKYLVPLTPSVEKITSLHGSSKFINEEI